jgi:hypothetical protein
MKSKNLWALVGLYVLLGGLVAGCGPQHSLAIAPTREMALAADLGWRRCPGAPPLTYRGVGLGEPMQVPVFIQDDAPIVSLTPVGLTGDLLVATASFTGEPETAADVGVSGKRTVRLGDRRSGNWADAHVDWEDRGTASLY